MLVATEEGLGPIFETGWSNVAEFADTALSPE